MIFVFSTNFFSASQTGSVFNMVIEFLFPKLSMNQIETLHVVFRKCMHVLSYGLLSFFFLYGFCQGQMNRKISINMVLFIVVFCVFYACVDEYHQSFSPLRTASLYDVGFDALGSVLVQLLFYLKNR